MNGRFGPDSFDIPSIFFDLDLLWLYFGSTLDLLWIYFGSTYPGSRSDTVMRSIMMRW